MSRSLLAASVAVALGLVATPALASDPSKVNIVVTSSGGSSAPSRSSVSGTYRLRAVVPVACWVSPQQAVSAGSGLIGQVQEACNAPGGFTVSASYRGLKAGERARLMYGDRAIDLSASGAQVLSRSNRAEIRSVTYRFDEVAVDEPLTLSLTIQPI